MTAGPRPVVGIGGRRSWIEVRLSWPIVTVMVAAALLRWAIRWRVELTTIAVAAIAGRWLAQHVGGWRHVGYLTGVVLVVLLVWPAGRRWLTAHAWCVLTRHRVRVALGQAGVSSVEGRLPYVIRTRPTPVGTRVTVWMRAGTAIEQLGEDDSVRLGIVRAACWAREVRLQRHPRWSHLVQLHLVRHDSLAPSVAVASVLPRLVAVMTQRQPHGATPGNVPADVVGDSVPTPREEAPL